MITRLRAVAIIAVCAGLCWFTVAFTFATLLRDRSPDAALGWWRHNAAAQALAAFRTISTDRSPAARARAQALAEAALRREPVNVVAPRTLALLAAFSGDDALAGRYLRYAEHLSRRDVPTQLLLLENEVRRNNIAGALRHYDRALRVSFDVRDTLLPILIQATSEPAIATAVGRLLQPRPPWWFPFAEHLVQQSRSPATMAYLLRRLRLDPGDAREKSLLIVALRRMVAGQAYRQADLLYRQAGGPPVDPRGNQVRNGDFEAADLGLPPLDWLLVNEDRLGAYKEYDAARRGNILRLVAENERGGEVARQLLVLAPGRYRISAVAGAIQGDAMSRPRLAVICARQGGPSLAVLAFPIAGAAGARMDSGFAVPSGCDGQWLTVITGSSMEAHRAAPWIDAISVRRE